MPINQMFINRRLFKSTMAHKLKEEGVGEGKVSNLPCGRIVRTY